MAWSRCAPPFGTIPSDSCEQLCYAPKTYRVPVDDLIVFPGSSCMASEMNPSPVQCIGIRRSGLISLIAAIVSFRYSTG